MADGMIQDNMAQPDGKEITLESVRDKIKMPPQLQEAYERVVLAGMKVMFSKETNKLLLDELDGEGDTAEKLGRGIAGLMLMLFKESNQTMPPAVIIPAGMELMMQAVDFVRRAGLAEVTNKDIGDAMEIFIGTVISQFGGNTQKMYQLVNNFDQTKIDAAQQQMGA